MHKRDESPHNLKDMIANMETDTGLHVNHLRTDEAEERLSQRFQKWLTEKEMKYEKYSPY